MTFQEKENQIQSILWIRIISWNDKNDTKCKNNDIIMLNNQKAEELS